VEEALWCVLLLQHVGVLNTAELFVCGAELVRGWLFWLLATRWFNNLICVALALRVHEHSAIKLRLMKAVPGTASNN
jgi:hypothetical protein